MKEEIEASGRAWQLNQEEKVGWLVGAGGATYDAGCLSLL